MPMRLDPNSPEWKDIASPQSPHVVSDYFEPYGRGYRSPPPPASGEPRRFEANAPAANQQWSPNPLPGIGWSAASGSGNGKVVLIVGGFFATYFVLGIIALAGSAVWSLPAGRGFITQSVVQLGLLTAAVVGVVLAFRKRLVVASFIASAARWISAFVVDVARGVKARWTAIARRGERAKDNVGGRYRLAGDEIRSARTAVRKRTPK
jgi:hypothetical protein